MIKDKGLPQHENWENKKHKTVAIDTDNNKHYLEKEANV